MSIICFLILPRQKLLTGKETLDEIADCFLACGVKTVVIKTGKDGCFIKRGDMTMKVPAVAGITAIDTIGAGDNFASGFIAALLEGKNLRECARFANATAAISVPKRRCHHRRKKQKAGRTIAGRIRRIMKANEKDTFRHNGYYAFANGGWGTWAIGGGPAWNGDLDRQICIDTILEAHRCGINLIDTAPGYNFGNSEVIVGQALKNCPVNRL